MTPVERTRALFAAMSNQDLAAYANCPLCFQDYFEQVMMKKYGVPEES